MAGLRGAMPAARRMGEGCTKWTQGFLTVTTAEPWRARNGTEATLRARRRAQPKGRTGTGHCLALVRAGARVRAPDCAVAPRTLRRAAGPGAAHVAPGLAAATSASRTLSDFGTFEVGPDDDHPAIQRGGMQCDALRFRAERKFAGKLHGQPFGVDVAFGDPIPGERDVVVAEEVLAFAGVALPTPRLCPIETHIAEKLHAYAMPRAQQRESSKGKRHMRMQITTRIAARPRVAVYDARTSATRWGRRTSRALSLRRGGR